MIAILDIDMGNLRNLSKAVYALGYDYVLADKPAALEEATHLMVPGVGAYRTAMEHIDARGLRQPIRQFAASGRPLLGICLGMQILSSSGVEGGGSEGLDLVPGRVVRMEPAAGLALPHVGWNTTRFRSQHPVFHKVKDGIDFYYVHSYSMRCDSEAHVLGACDYGGEFASIVGRANVLGFQFHPEKSQSNGLKLLENFCEWNGRC